MSEIHFCANHPSRETSLRCNRCEKYICPSCAVRTPTGYRCKECVREHQKIFDNATARDYLIVFFLGGLLSFLGSLATLLIISIIWGFIILFLAPTAGVFIGNVLRSIIRGRHSKALNWTLAAAMVLGVLPMLFVTGLGGLLAALFGGGLDLIGAFYMFGPAFWLLVYAAMATPAAYAQFSGIRLRR